MKIYDKNEIPEGYQQKSRTVYIILAIFLYQFGAHEFYRGSTKSGFAFLGNSIIFGTWFFAGLADGYVYFFPLVLLLIFFVLMIIAIIKVDRDDNGVLMK